MYVVEPEGWNVMSFDHRDVRRSMDVYTLDNVYLGSVVAVLPGPGIRTEERVQEEARQSSIINGEMLGPVPTQTSGNRGPKTQGAAALYATQPDTAKPLGKGAIKVGTWWGRRRTIPLDAIQAVSLERVVLKYRKKDLDQLRR